MSECERNDKSRQQDKLCCLCASWIAADCLDDFEGEPCHKICKAEGVGKAYRPRVPEIGDGNWICLKGDHDGAHFEIMTGGGIKIEVGGSVHVRTAREWHELAVQSFAKSSTRYVSDDYAVQDQIAALLNLIEMLPGEQRAPWHKAYDALTARLGAIALSSSPLASTSKDKP